MVKMELMTGDNYDVIVVGAGHAGCEAALASARLGCQTLLITLNLETIAQMSCNPAIGGIGKEQLTKEVDALGGEMAKVTDQSGIQFRVLNTKKGQAVRSLRVQTDRLKYRVTMRRTLEGERNLLIKQGEVVRILVEGKRAIGVETALGERFFAKAIVLAPGTFLSGLIHIGLTSFPGGRMGENAANLLSRNLSELGFRIGRFKTGTPPRLDGRTIDFSRLPAQSGDEPPPPFSFWTDFPVKNYLPCYITYTNPKTHEIVRSGLDRSPLYQGVIKGTGVRYCPSIEDKVMKFSEKERHQVFLEPEGLNTFEFYPNGISTSLPIDVQIKMVKSIEGLEKAEILRPGYAIEHDYSDPTQLKPTLETRLYENLFFAGQINGTTGYEEAAGQGIVAGINAAHRAKGKEEFILSRSDGYIGVLIDDLITKGTNEPYRMFTSRVEFRLLLRGDNADLRLSERAYKIGLLKEEQYKKVREKKERIERLLDWLRKTKVNPKEEINRKLVAWQTSPIKEATSLYELLKRPEIGLSQLLELGDFNLNFDSNVASCVEVDVKYEGYIERTKREMEKFCELEEIKIPPDFDYKEVKGLSNEAKEKLSKIKPLSLGQAYRIPGITPSAILNLMIYLKKR